jgi:spermidine synthase
VFIAGASVMSTEMSASRLLAPFFGSSILVWANIIGLILIYLSAGYVLGGRLADRHPSMRYLGNLMLVAAALVAVLPFIAAPILDTAVGAFADASVGAFLGSFFAVMALFAVPITLLGMASPFAIRLAVTSLEHAGEVAGRLYALSTVGSIIGTFLPVAVLIPAIGTRRTMLVTAGLLALAAAPAVGRRAAVLVPATIFALTFLPTGTVKPTSGVLFEGESPYQFVQIRQLAGGERILQLNEGWAQHSVWQRDTVITDGVWDHFSLIPALHAERVSDVAVIGNAGGTVGRAYGELWPDVNVLGIEIDPLVTDVGRRWLGLEENPRVEVATADGRTWLQTNDRRFDAIFLDAYKQPYIPFYLTTQEFFDLTRERLRPGGMVAANVGRVPDDDRLVDAIAGTMATRFAAVYRWRAEDYNEIVVGFTEPVSVEELRRRMGRAPFQLARVVERARSVEMVGPTDDPLTDDHAPVEWLTDQMIVNYAAEGE